MKSEVEMLKERIEKLQSELCVAHRRIGALEVEVEMAKGNSPAKAVDIVLRRSA